MHNLNNQQENSRMTSLQWKQIQALRKQGIDKKTALEQVMKKCDKMHEKKEGKGHEKGEKMKPSGYGKNKPVKKTKGMK